MLHKLRRKFVLINLGFVVASLVFLNVFMFIKFNQSKIHRIERVINRKIEVYHKNNPDFIFNKSSLKKNDNNILKQYKEEKSNEEEKNIKKIKSKKEEKSNKAEKSNKEEKNIKEVEKNKEENNNIGDVKTNIDVETEENKNSNYEKVGIYMVLVDKDNMIVDEDKNYAKLVIGNDRDVIVKKILDCTENDGLLKSDDIFFVKHKLDNGYKLIGFTRMKYLWNIDEEMLIFFKASIIVIFIFVILSIILSKIVVHPISKAWETKKQFISDVSHDLKTPLSVIIANNEILKQHCDDTVMSQKKWIDSTSEEALYLKKMLEDMLFLAKSDEGMFLYDNVEVVNISEIVQEKFLQFEPIAFEKNISMDYNILPDINICGDISQLKRLVYILIDNAIKYCGKDGKVRVNMKKTSNYIYISFSNTSEPISKEEREKIFNRFYRSDKSRNREGGCGLGLAIAKRIIDFHKGSISISYEESFGNVFTLKFSTDIDRNSIMKKSTFGEKYELVE